MSRNLSVLLLGCGMAIALLSLFSLTGQYPDFKLPGVSLPRGRAPAPLEHMSPVTAFSFLAAGIACILAGVGVSERSGCVRTMFWGASLLLAGFSVLFLAYLLRIPMFYDGRIFPPSASSCLAFMGLWSALLLQYFPLAWPDVLRRDQAGHGELSLVAGFVLLAVGIVAAGCYYHRNIEHARLNEVRGRLTSVAALKARELAHWRAERMVDARFFYANSAFSSIVSSYLSTPVTRRAEHVLHVWLASVRENRNYDGLFLLDGQGRDTLRYSPESNSVPPPLVLTARQALRTGEITFADLYRDPASGKIAMGIVIPIFEAGPSKKNLAALVLRIAPETYLFPFVRAWPTVSTTAESVLVRREGDSVLILNDMRFRRGTALKQKISLGRSENPAVMAVLGRTGIVQGADCRGVPMLASLHAIPGSPWYLVARIELYEVYQPLRERVWITVLLVCALLVSAASWLAFVWKQRNIAFYRQAELDAKRNRERLQCLVNVLQSPGNRVEDIMDDALSEMLGLTGSRYGYLFFYNEETRRFVLGSWSDGVMPNCGIQAPREGYALEDTGVWGDVVRLRKPVVINDFGQPDPRRKGYPDGHVPLTRFLSVPIIDQGKIVAVAGVANKDGEYDESDMVQLSLLVDAVWKVAERKRSEDELKQRNAELERFTYAVSHDLKSPLVTISAFLSYLESDMAAGDQERIGRDIGFIRGATDKMGQLLGELLEFLRVGWVVSQPLWIDYRELVQEALRLVAGQISRRGVRVVTQGGPIMLLGDRSRLVELFQNLVENAVKYMGEQETPVVEVGADQDGGETVFFVRDNGMGIDRRYRENIFGLFNKLDVASEGSGLGLALVRRIVEMYGGRVWVESEGEGSGSCFRFTLPRALERGAGERPVPDQGKIDAAEECGKPSQYGVATGGQ